ncbi:PqiC family protein [Azospirillum brasilense]|uniref:PqiC family protein n=1 Tax=Azospirillum brasilense TaxID=192 RepID=UPI001EDC7DB8|nr:PqiC family protein [Azospirillum brasilense]UKJ76641.1 membrane integrity-associated transporter subunit PqiC [Azospirillum brasilense]
MTRPFRLYRLAAVGLAALPAACSPPTPNLYTIAPVSGAPVPGAPAANTSVSRTSAPEAAGPKVVLLRQVGIARYLERPQIVRSSENYRLEVMENDWWGEPLGEMLGRVLADELRRRLSRSVVVSEAGTVSANPDATIEVDVQRLDEDTSGTLVLQAQASVTGRRRAEPTLRSFRIAVPPPKPGVAGQVAATSTAVGQLADGLASMLNAGLGSGLAAAPVTGIAGRP